LHNFIISTSRTMVVGGTGMEYSIDKTALLIVDMQNDFVREGAGMEVPDTRDTIETILKLIAFARENAIPVVYTKFMAGPKRTMLWNWSPQIETVNACVRGYKRFYPDVDKAQDCTDVIDELYPQEGDYIVEKYGYSSFHNTNLLDVMYSIDRDIIIVTGTVTQICVEDTVHDAFHNRIKVIVASDAVSSFDKELHDASLKNINMKYGAVMDSDGIIRTLEGA
jgi:nicotinamidase-related amidase